MSYRLTHYIALLQSLCEKGYRLGPVRMYFEEPKDTIVYLRHDVDRLVNRAIRMADFEKNEGIHSTYYFRCSASGRFPSNAIQHVARLGHEVGFHYETLVRYRGDLDASLEAFARELDGLRRLAEVKTIVAHGSPMSKYRNSFNSSELNYAQFGLLGDPQHDFDYTSVLYVTDTGGTFGSLFNYRDWSSGKNFRQPSSPLKLSQLLDPQVEPLVLLNSHPERWPETSAGVLCHTILDGAVNLAKMLRHSRQAGGLGMP